jgi:NAD(P)-dependent dehydrogenase (short-subunit alcohol dehydrogenase family)
VSQFGRREARLKAQFAHLYRPVEAGQWEPAGGILSPGSVDTPSLRRALGKAGGEDRADGIVRPIAERSPLGRIGNASDIGKAAVFLASDASSYVNGVELFVDGGLAQV